MLTGKPCNVQGNPVLSRLENNMWKAIQGYEGYYEVNDLGEVRSLDRYVTDSSGAKSGKRRLLKGAMMKLTESKAQYGGTGYLVVNLRKNHTSWVVPVHILVAKAFIPNPDNMPTVNHKDGNKLNNRVSNLEWVSYSDNNVHALKNGLRKPRGNQIVQYALDGRYIATYKSATEAARLTGFSRNAISHCLNGRTRQSFGYIWIKQSESQTTIPQGSTQEDELPAEAQRPL